MAASLQTLASSQEAYKNSFKSKSDVMVLDPNTDFFKYMRDANGSKNSGTKK